MGWDEYRRIVFERQKEIGIVAADTELPPHDPDVPEWSSLSDDQKRLYARMMQVYAGFVSHADHQFGRIIDTLEEIGELDNTLIMVISDNGASAEGGTQGKFTETSFINFVEEKDEDILPRIDELGGPTSYGHYPWGWAMAGNTPFRRWKREVWRGGSTDPFILHWPAGIGRTGELRTQYAHIIDMVPTVLDLLGIEPPATIAGVKQAPIEGVSFAHTINDAQAPTRHTTQYYEMLGTRAIDHDDWRAVCGWPGPSFAEAAQKGRRLMDQITPEVLAVMDAEEWQLFHITDDPTESRNVASEHPEKLRELIDLWWAEAEKYNVLPLDGTFLQRGATERPHATKAREKFVYYPGLSVVPVFNAPPVLNRSHSITAELEIPARRCRGRDRLAGRLHRRLRLLRPGRTAALRPQLRRQVPLRGRLRRAAANRPGHRALRVRGHHAPQDPRGSRSRRARPAVLRRSARRRRRDPDHNPDPLRPRRVLLRLRRRSSRRAHLQATVHVHRHDPQSHHQHQSQPDRGHPRGARRPPRSTSRRAPRTGVKRKVTAMTDTPLDELGPVDYVVVEFPAGASNFTGEMAAGLLALVDAGTIRVIDVLILTKDDDGTVEATELSDVGELGELQAIEAQLAELLAEEDVEHLAAAMEPGSTAGVLIWENLWAAPFASAVRRSGGQLIANGRIPIQAIIASHRGRRSTHDRRRLTMPLRPARRGRVGVIRAPVAKTAVVAKAVTPGPAPVAKTAVVAAAVTPGRRRRRI